MNVSNVELQDVPLNELYKFMVLVSYTHSYFSSGGVSNHLRVLNSTLSSELGLTTYQIYIDQNSDARLFIIEPFRQSCELVVPKKIENKSNTEDDSVENFYVESMSQPDSEFNLPAASLASELRGRFHFFLEKNTPLHLLRIRSFINLLLRPRNRWLGRFLPRISAHIKSNDRVVDAIHNIICKVKLAHPNKRIVFIDHAPYQPLSHARLKAAEEAGATSAVFYHGGFERADIRLLIETARHYPFGALTLTRCPSHLLKLIDSTGDQVSLLKNVVDMAFFDPKAVDYGSFRETIGTRLNQHIILVPARITFQKGIHDLIDALGLLPLEQLNELKVVFAGEINSHIYRRWLEKKIKSNHALSTLSYSFVGNLDQVVLRQAYRDCKLVVLPTYSEGAPRVLIEAQAMGIRCVATDVDGTQDTVVDKRFVRLVNVKDIKEMSLAIKNVLLQDEISEEELGFIRETLDIRFGLIACTQRHGRFYRRICS